MAKIDFPAYESGRRPGFDGVVECADEHNPWVPFGPSVWELSTRDRVKSKADEDFAKRTDETSVEFQIASYFVFATPRHFRGKKQWIQDNSKVGHWRGVKALDADDFEQWSETAPAGLRAWIGRMIGARPNDIDDVAERWEAISKSTTPELLPSVFLAGREGSIARLHQWLADTPGRFNIESRSPGEVIDFFCAAVAAMDKDLRLATESRTVIVYTVDAWRECRDLQTASVLVVEPSIDLTSEEIGRAIRNGHHVLSFAEPAIFDNSTGVELERASTFDLSKALESSGYSPVRAGQLARGAGGSLAILKCRLEPSGKVDRPAWTPSISSEVFAACLLLGGWSDSDSDRAAFGRIAGREYSSCQAELQQMANSRDPLLLHAAGNWRLISKDHAWALFGDRVSTNALKEFETLAVEILADDDPRFGFPENERFYAQFHGHVAIYSDVIKNHVAETLAVLGTFSQELASVFSVDISGAVDRIVAKLLSPTTTWHRWASLGSQLPLLAEASPSSFLHAVHEDLNRAEPELGKILHEEEDTLFGRCNHAGLLWALEVLAWPTQYVGDVVRALLKLSAIDPGGRWANRPMNCIREILLYWMPQTMATVDDRIKILDMMIKNDRKIAWSVMLELLPGITSDSSTPIRRPYWRAWAVDWKRLTNRAEMSRFVSAVTGLLIQEAGQDSSCWLRLFENLAKLLKNFAKLPDTLHDIFVEAAERFSDSGLADQDRRALHEELTNQLHLHREYDDSDWPLSEEFLNRLDVIAQKLQPENVVFRNAWLFNPNRDFERGEVQDAESELARDRRTAISEILTSEGFAGIEALVENAASPMAVGSALSSLTENDYVSDVVPSRLNGERRDLEFAHGYIWNRFWPDHWTWVDETAQLCDSDSSTAWFYTMLPFDRPVWERVTKSGEGVHRLYWERCHPLHSSLSAASISIAVAELILHARPVAAADLLAMGLYDKHSFDFETLISPLESLLQLSPEKFEVQFKSRDTHDIQRLIEALQKHPQRDEKRLIQIEWHYLRVLDDHRGQAPRTLFQHLAKHPEFFIEVLKYSCYPQSERHSDGRPVPTAHERYMAQQAYHLLTDWDLLPGTQSDGSIDESALREWCHTALNLADAADRREMCELRIGDVFGNAIYNMLHSPDGKWPCPAAQNVIEEIATITTLLKSGMGCAIHNGGGAVFRSSGGGREKNLAQLYRSKAEEIRFDAPALASVLDTVGETFEDHARRSQEHDRWAGR
ncbi:MAG: hypothetical protein WEB58_22300 [Planctomycetaceae bacterium]